LMAQQTARRRANPEARRAADARYLEKHRERERARKRAYFEANRRAFYERSRAWVIANPERMLSHYATRRARVRNAFVEFVDREVVFERDRGVCGICGAPSDPANWQLDHVVPLARGGEHSYANTQVSHPFCNQSKGARLADEMKAVA
jgi:5-methylcytosine-specific restriction endonuclease McrA